MIKSRPQISPSQNIETLETARYLPRGAIFLQFFQSRIYWHDCLTGFVVKLHCENFQKFLISGTIVCNESSQFYPCICTPLFHRFASFAPQ